MARDFPTQSHRLALQTKTHRVGDNGFMSNQHTTSAVYNAQTQVLIVESCAALRLSLCRWLRMMLPTCRFVAVGTAEEALAMAEHLRPHLIVMDTRLPGVGGIEATRCMKLILPISHVVIYSHCDAAIYRDKALEAGAAAFVLKRRAEHDLLPQLRQLIKPTPATRGGA